MNKENKSKIDEKKFEAYLQEAYLQYAGITGDERDSDQFREDANKLRPVFHNRDALYVSTSDPSELETVRRNFVVKDLKIEDKELANKLIAKVARLMKGIKMKNRIAFYFLLDIVHKRVQDGEASLENEEEDRLR